MTAAVLRYNPEHVSRNDKGPVSFGQSQLVARHACVPGYTGVAVCGRTPELGEFILIAPSLAGCDRVWETLMALDGSVTRIDKALVQKVHVVSQASFNILEAPANVQSSSSANQD